MDYKFWLGFFATIIAGSIGWVIRNAFVAYRKLSNERDQLKDYIDRQQKSSFEKSAHEINKKIDVMEGVLSGKTGEFEKELQKNWIAITELKIRLEQFTDIFAVVRQLSNDVSKMKGYFRLKKSELGFDDDDGGTSSA